MGFIDDLRSYNGNGNVNGGQPSFGSSMDANGPSATLNSLLPFYDAVRQRKSLDFQNQQRFMTDEGIRRNQLEKTFNPASGMPAPQGMNVQYGGTIPDTNRVQDLQNEQLDLSRRRVEGEIGSEKEKLALGREKLGVDKGQLALDEKKNSNIYNTKQKELEDKAAASQRNADLLEKRIQAGENNAMMLDQYHRAALTAKDAQMAAERAQKDNALNETTRQHDERMKAMHDQLEQNGFTVEEVTRSDGTKETKIVRKGAQNQQNQAPKSPNPAWEYVPKPGGGWTAQAVKGK